MREAMHSTDKQKARLSINETPPVRNKFWLLGTELIVVLLCLAGAKQAAEKATLPLILTDEHGGVVVERADEAGSVPAHDRIAAIDGMQTNSEKDIEDILDAYAIGDTVTVGFARGTALMEHRLKLTAYYSFFYDAIQLLVALVFMGLGSFVLRRKPKDESSRVFHALAYANAALIMLTWGHYSMNPYGLGHFLRAVFPLGWVAAGATVLHFSYVFPARRAGNPRRILQVCYGLGVLLALAGAASSLAATLVSRQWAETHQALLNMARIFTSTCFVIAVVNFMYSYAVARNESLRRRLRLIIFGSGLSMLGFVVIWEAPKLFSQTPIIPEELMLLIILIAPATMAVSIVRYRTFDIDFFIRRSTVYTIVILILGGLYAVAQVGAMHAFGMVSAKWYIGSSAVLFVLMLFLFEPTRGFAKRFVDRKLYRIKYDARKALQEFIEETKKCYDPFQLAERLVSRIASLIPVERIGLFQVDSSSGFLKLIAQQNLPELEGKPIHLLKGILLVGFRNIVSLPEIVEPGVEFIEPEDVSGFRKHGMTIALPVLSKDETPLAYLVLGERRPPRRFSIEDVELLRSMSLQAGMELDRISLQQKFIAEREAAAHSEELNRAKSHFVSSVSHDLKTPLTSIKMFAELLRAPLKGQQAESARFLDIIEGECDRLTQLINNVLDVARIEQGAKSYQRKRLLLNETVGEAVEAVMYQLQLNKFEIETSFMDPDIPFYVDKTACVAAVSNLLTNAMKYSLQDKRIRIRTFIEGGYGAIEVTDRGRGIDAAEIDRIFEPYFRSESPDIQNISGTGLGLSVIKHVMDGHGGKVTVDSVLGQGSTFVLYFPLSGLNHETDTNH